MVFYFTSAVVPGTPYKIYMGEDKHENEDLIKYGFPEDIWFHVDKLSSAHVYLRLPKGSTIDDIPQAVLDDCCQLVKANSIQGCKMNNLSIVYTPWENLKKTGDMAVGQVGFHKGKEVRSAKVEKKINETVNRLNKTKVEIVKPNLAEEREQRDREEREEAKKKMKLEREEKMEREKEERRKNMEEAELRNYTTLMTSENMTSNADIDSDASDDFM
ncbi:coiled-coil domain-containing protein 25-like [Amphiura filiformis]|uniref:coiled-coil domain-containing protein 25-like n=1 Tax=Amphiura filiformis TaxID=82378 RepID=UPI003B227A48